MALLVPKEGEKEMLFRSLEITGTTEGVDGKRLGAVKLRLYYNNITPDDDTTIDTGSHGVNELREIDSDAGTPVTGEGTYAPKTLLAANWTVVNSVASYPEQTFTLDGGDAGYAVYGYFVTVEKADTTSPVILWAEKFPTPFNIDGASGGQIKITLKLEIE